MKRITPATPFRVIGPGDSAYTTSSSSPPQDSPDKSMENPDQSSSSNLALPEGQMVRKGRGRSSAIPVVEEPQEHGEPRQGPEVHLHDQRTLNVLNQSNIPPHILEQLVHDYVKAEREKVAMQVSVERQQYTQQLQQQYHTSIQQQQEAISSEAQQRVSQVTREAQQEVLRQQQLAEQAQRDLIIAQDSAQAHARAIEQATHMAEQANREVQRVREQAAMHMQASQQATLLSAEHTRQQAEGVMAEKDERIEQLLHELDALRSSPNVGRLFDTASELGGRAPSVASASPLNVVYCPVCGNQNVSGRGSCWNCRNTLDEPNNGPDLFEPPPHERHLYPSPERPPSVATIRENALVSRPMLAGGSPTRRDVPLPKAPGGPRPLLMPVTREVMVDGNPVHQMHVDPRLIYGVTTPKSVSEAEFVAPHGYDSVPRPGGAEYHSQKAPKATQGPAYPPGGFIGTIHEASSSHAPQAISIATPRKKESSDSEAGSESSGDPVGGGSRLPGGDPPEPWLQEGETEDHIYKIKHLRNISITKLPTDATSCREWRAALLASVSRIDLTARDVLVKYTTYCMDGGRGRAFRSMLQEDQTFIPFNKHLAAELIKQDVLATNTDLAHELSSYVESCTAMAQGPKGMALLNIVASYYETGLTHSVALDQMHLLSLTLAGKGAKDLIEFVRKANYILHGLKQADRPAPATLFQWLWQQVKRVPILSRITDKVRESSLSSKKRTFDWLWAQIAEELRERRHDMNYDNISKGLKDVPNPKNLACPSGLADDKAGDRDSKGGKSGKGKDKGKDGKGKGDKGKGKKGKDSKGDKGKGKDKDGKGKDKKGKDGTSPSVPKAAAAAAAASTVTITEVQADELMSVWRGFCEFAKKALPALNVFLKVSVPIASLVSSIVDNTDVFGVDKVAGMLHPAVEDFKGLSLEFIGDTGAAHDIGSLKALAEQGFERGMLEPWLKCLENPVKFATGGGPQTSVEALRVYAKDVGDLNMHLLKNCPLAMSIGKQVGKGRTFVWQHGKVPFIALDHKKCRVWCPVENRWYAKRIQNDVPIFSLQASGGPSQGLSFNGGKTLYQPAVTATCPDSCFCGDCLERLPACVCQLYPEKDEHPEQVCLDVAAVGASGVQEEVEAVSDSYKEHRRKQHRKDNKRRKWEAMKKIRKVERGELRLPRGEQSMIAMMHDMAEFFLEQSQTNTGRTGRHFEALAVEVKKELEQFDAMPISKEKFDVFDNEYSKEKQSAQAGLPGKGKFIELCTEPTSNLGKVGDLMGIEVIRCTKEENNLEHDETVDKLKDIIEENPGIDLWASLPCSPWSQWQYLNAHRYGEQYRKKLAKSRELSLKLLNRFVELARHVKAGGGDVHFEWPRHALGWRQNALCKLIREIDMMVVNFDGCAVGLVDKAGTPFLKKWRLATTNERLARTFADKRCKHDHSFEHAQIVGSNTPTTAIYPVYMCELVFSALFPEIVYRDVPAMPVMQSCEHVSQHVPNEPLEGAVLEAVVYESVDSFACPADPEEHELEPLESRDERLKREATSLEHMTLHEKKNPFCEHCIRGRMLKRYAKSHREEPEEAERVFERPTGFGHLIEADNMFPSEESQGNEGEKTALVVLDRFSGVSLVYPGRDRSEDTVFEELKHFGGHRLNGDPNVVFKSDAATELTKAAARLCWNIAPSVPRSWPHNAHTEREIRAIKELRRPAHLQAGFHKKLWPLSVVFAAKARAFWTPCMVRDYEKGTDVEALKQGKSRWHVATGSEFPGPKYPLGSLVFYRAKGDGMAEPTTKPGLFVGWRVDAGLRYREVVQVLDYENVRNRAHLHWSPRDMYVKEVFFPPLEHIQFPLAVAARQALFSMTDADAELRKAEYNKSLESGVLPYDVVIDAYPVEDRPTPPRHAYITYARLLEHGFTKGCSGCSGGHYRHSKACRERFDGLYPREAGALPETQFRALRLSLLCQRPNQALVLHPRRRLRHGLNHRRLKARSILQKATQRRKICRQEFTHWSLDSLAGARCWPVLTLWKRSGRNFVE